MIYRIPSFREADTQFKDILLTILIIVRKVRMAEPEFPRSSCDGKLLVFRRYNGQVVITEAVARRTLSAETSVSSSLVQHCINYEIYRVVIERARGEAIGEEG
jgi:hypothetical protein